MVDIEITIIATLGVLNLFLLVFGFRSLNKTLDLLFQALEIRVKAILEELIEQFQDNIAGGIEPVNPIQAAFAQMIVDRIQAPSIPGEITEVVKLK